jgi:membrane fusion protein, multidrug efflux system
MLHGASLRDVTEAEGPCRRLLASVHTLLPSAGEASVEASRKRRIGLAPPRSAKGKRIMDERSRSSDVGAKVKPAPSKTDPQTEAKAKVDVPRRESDDGAKSREPGSGRSRLRPLLYLLVALLLGAGAWRLLSSEESPPKRNGQAVQQVGAATVGTGDIREELSGLGTVTPLATITVQTQINGQLMSVGSKEGQIVQKGDFLAQIDPRPSQAALDQAQGALAHDTGLLKQAQSDLQRFETLGRQDSIALQQVADQEFLVEQDKGTVAEDEATIETDKLNLTYCHIVAPVSGRVGLRLVDPGNYVQTTNTTGLLVLTQLQPISVIFVLPEDQIQAVWQDVRVGKTLTVTAYNRSDDTQIASGVLESMDNEIDTTTGTVKLRATFPNADESLFPNQFVNTRLLARTLSGVTVAPVAAIQYGAPGTFVYLIKADGSVAVQAVKTGVTDGDRVQILSGLKPGDTVVVDGADRLRGGTKVRIVADQANPAANTNNGPGAPPGEQPGNASPVPQGERTDGRQGKVHAQPSSLGQPNAQ